MWKNTCMTKYKILSGKYDGEAASFVKLWKDMTSRTGVQGNSLKIFPQRARTEIRKYSNALRIVKHGIVFLIQLLLH